MSGCAVVFPGSPICYCDFVCVRINDCCRDVLERIPFSCTVTSMYNRLQYGCNLHYVVQYEQAAAINIV